MSKEEIKKIYNKAKENSIGKDKTDSNRRKKRTILRRIKTTALIFMLVFATNFIIGHRNHQKQMDAYEDLVYETRDLSLENDHGFSITEIDEYGKEKAQQLLSDKGFVAESTTDEKGYYNYTIGDFSRLGELSTGDVYSLSKIVDHDTMNKIMQANGYKTIYDYARKNNYVDEKGQTDFTVFMNAAQEELAQEMSESYSEGVSK